MTLEAWVHPTSAPTGARRSSRSAPAALAYALYSSAWSDNPSGHLTTTGEQRRARAGRADRRHVDAPRRDLRRHDAAALRQRHPGGDARDRAERSAPRRGRCASAPTRLGRALPRPDRRGARLQPRAQRRRDPADMATPVVGRRAARPGPARDRPVLARRARGRSCRSTSRCSRTARSRPGTASRPRSTPSTSGTRRPSTFQPIPTGRNLFCAGHITLADGRLLVVGGHIAGLRGHEGHEPLQPADRHLAARRRHERGALVPDRDDAAGRPRVRGLGRQHHAQRPGPERAAHERLQHAAVDLQPGDEHAGPTCRRPRAGCRSTRSCSCCRTASSFDAGPDTHDAHARPRHEPVDDRRHEPDRRPERGHVPARQDPEVRHLVRSGVPRPRRDATAPRRST